MSDAGVWFRRVLPLCVVAALLPGLHASQQSSSEQTQETARDLLQRYAANGVEAVAGDLRRVTDWSGFAGDVVRAVDRGPAEVAAAFALEVAAACQDESLQEVPVGGGPRHSLLSAAWKRVTSPDARPEFVLAWVEAMIALLQGTGGEQPFPYFKSTFDAIGVLDITARRFPGQSPLAFSRAMVLSQRVHADAAEGWFSQRGRQYLARLGRRGDPWPEDNVADAIKRFEPLMDDQVVGPESMLPVGYYKGLEGRSNEALEVLKRLETSTNDTWLLYLARFFQGQILTSLRRYSEAIARFELALDLFPRAGSGRRALAALRYLDGNRASAVQLLEEAARQDNVEQDDPWPWFAYGEYRRWPERIAKVRSLVR